MNDNSPAAAFWQRPLRQRRLVDLVSSYQRGDFSPADIAHSLADKIAAQSKISDLVYISSGIDRLRDTSLGGHRSAQTGTTEKSGIEGVPVSIKDLFDVAGEVTRAGSRVLEDSPPAKSDAPAVARLRQAGALAFGRTNMSEFAFSAIGLNPHYGSPPNPLDPERITGGSTSGGAASVAFGLAAATLGSDTGGSLRIPAAWCGITGFKPSQASVPGEGAWPLSPSLDCIGPMAPSVDCCSRLWAALAGQTMPVLDAEPRSLRLALPAGALLSELDAGVAEAFKEVCQRLRDAGCQLETLPVEALDLTLEINGRGGLVVPEAAGLHHRQLLRERERFDPLVAARISGGLEISAIEYMERLWPRRDYQSRFASEMKGFDGLLLPTTASLPPKLKDLSDSAICMDINKRGMRNTNLFNYLDASAISLPFTAPGADFPIGVMLARPQGEDVALLQCAHTVETMLHC